MKHWLVLMVVFGLTGCDNPDMSDLFRYVDEVRARAPGPIEPLPEFKEVKTFLYVPGGRRSPFEPETAEKGAQLIVEDQFGPKPDPTRAPEELEGFSLDALKMVGTLDKGGSNWGLVQTPDGTIHRVQAGNYMGQNYGRIVAITEYEITLIELVKTASGNFLERDAALALGNQQ